MSIQPLPPDVVAQIKSSIVITNLNGVVLELVKNSLDAAASKIDITIDYARGGAIVDDDGLGILPSEFELSGQLGKLYHSSKLHHQGPVHGGKGTFLASLSAVSLLSITAHHHLHRSHNTLSMHKSEVISRQLPALPQYHLQSDHGTRVTVRNLFGGMPVRVKQRAVAAAKEGGNSKDWDALKRDLVLLMLAWPRNVSLSLHEVGSSRKLVMKASRYDSSSEISTTKSLSILSQAAFITPEERSSWISLSGSTSDFTVAGLISLIPSANKHVQFLALGIQPLFASDGSSILHDKINRLFSNSAFGSEEDTEELNDTELERRARDARYHGAGYTAKELKGAKKGVDRWPMFYINIRHARAAKDMDADDILDGVGSDLSTIVELLQAMVLEFLTKHHFRPRAVRFRKNQVFGHAKESKPVSPKRSQEGIIKSSEQSQSLQTKSGPRPTLTSTREQSTKSSTARFDALGKNIKLPSFHRSGATTFESPFDGWSRIKIGKSMAKTVLFQGHTQPLSVPSRPSTAPPPSLESTSLENLRSSTTSVPRSERSERYVAPIFSSTGKLMRRPLEDVNQTPAPSSQAADPSLTNCEQSSSIEPTVLSTSEHHDDNLISWLNPITKVRTLVNSRTGLTVPETTPESAIRTRSRSCTPTIRDQRVTIQVPNREPSPWIRSLLRSWDNPIYQPTELAIPQIPLDGLGGDTQQILHGRQHHCTQLDVDKAFQTSSVDIKQRISKAALASGEVISQVDKKFILVKLHPIDSKTTEKSMLVFIDQHAADERIRIEALMEELCTPAPQDCGSGARVLSVALDKPLWFDVSPKETPLFQTHKSHFANWGIVYDIVTKTTTSRELPTDHKSPPRLIVRRLPPGISERGRLSPNLIISLLRTEIWRLADSALTSFSSSSSTSSSITTFPSAAEQPTSWVRLTATCPPGLLELLNSRACRSAVMFNDELSRDQCEVLVRRLARCVFPFQCAHGRPSLVPLVDLGGLEGEGGGGVGAESLRTGNREEETFGRAFERMRGRRGGE